MEQLGDEFLRPRFWVASVARDVADLYLRNDQPFEWGLGSFPCLRALESVATLFECGADLTETWNLLSPYTAVIEKSLGRGDLEQFIDCIWKKCQSVEFLP